MNTKLGISIPTYKRPKQLTLFLQSVIESARPFSVPVYVLDDSGDDTNVAVCEAMQDTYPYVYLIQNEQNLGIDCNIVKSVNACGPVETFTWRTATFDVLDGWARLMERMRPVYGEDVCRR